MFDPAQRPEFSGIPLPRAGATLGSVRRSRYDGQTSVAPSASRGKMTSRHQQNRPRRRKSAGSQPRPTDAAASAERLQKVMAAAGVGSRRHCEELIVAGRVEVDRKTVTELGTKVDPSRQEIRVDGSVLGPSRKLYYLVHKPIGVVSTNFDPAQRPRVIDLVPQTKERLFTVGRLDLTSEGLILVTNDGELANRLAHPRYGVEKTYHVLVAGTPEPSVFEQLRQGIHLAEGVARVVSVRFKSRHKQSTVLEIVLAEGRNREIRRLLAKVGHKVLRLKRVALGPLRLKDLPSGEWRRLTTDELNELRRTTRRRGRRPVHSAAMAGEPEQPVQAKASAPERQKFADRGQARPHRGKRASFGRGRTARPGRKTS